MILGKHWQSHVTYRLKIHLYTGIWHLPAFLDRGKNITSRRCPRSWLLPRHVSPLMQGPTAYCSLLHSSHLLKWSWQFMPLFFFADE
jgi:hypothetical protein